MQVFASVALVAVLWVVIGYSLAFDTSGGMQPDVFNLHSIVSGFNQFLLLNVDLDSRVGTIPETVFVVFQMTFAIITAALVTGAAAGGVVAALIASKLMFSKVDLTIVLNGALAGLVAITADPASPSALLAVIIGGIGGVIVAFSIVMFDKIKIDDPVGAISVHAVVGIWGVMAVRLSNPDATFVGQIAGLVLIGSFVFIASFVVWFILKKIMGIRINEDDEMEGVDAAECGMEAYPEFTNK